MRIQRLFNSNYVLEYHSGKYNCLADIFSYNIVEFNNNQETRNQVGIESVFGCDMHVMITADEIKGETTNYQILCQLIKFVH